VKFLVQLDKLIRLLETPIFAYLRLQVLNQNRPFLIQCACLSFVILHSSLIIKYDSYGVFCAYNSISYVAKG